MTTTDILQTDLQQILSLDFGTEEEQALFLAGMGELVWESALLRLVEGLSEEQTSALEYYLETEPDPQLVVQHLIKTYPSFVQILETEIAHTKEDAMAILGTDEQTKTLQSAE